MTEHNQELLYARHERSHCLAPGLFRALRRGERKTAKLDVSYEYGDGRRVEFSGPEPLGADDLRVLQGLVAIAGPSGLILGPEAGTKAGEQLRLALDLKWEAAQADAMVVKGSYRALAQTIGISKSKNVKAIQQSIERLWKVSVIAQEGRRRKGFRLLSEYASDDLSGKLYVALNPLIAQTVMGGQHVRIDMKEVRSLKGEAARLIHQRLSAWIDPGKKGVVALSTLCEYVWLDEVSPSGKRSRLHRVRKALAELERAGWKVAIKADGNCQIRRPKMPSESIILTQMGSKALS